MYILMSGVSMTFCFMVRLLINMYIYIIHSMDVGNVGGGGGGGAGAPSVLCN